MSALTDHMDKFRISDRHGVVHLAADADQIGVVRCGYNYRHPADIDNSSFCAPGSPWRGRGVTCPSCADSFDVDEAKQR